MNGRRVRIDIHAAIGEIVDGIIRNCGIRCGFADLYTKHPIVNFIAIQRGIRGVTRNHNTGIISICLANNKLVLVIFMTIDNARIRGRIPIARLKGFGAKALHGHFVRTNGGIAGAVHRNPTLASREEILINRNILRSACQVDLPLPSDNFEIPQDDIVDAAKCHRPAGGGRAHIACSRVIAIAKA